MPGVLRRFPQIDAAYTNQNQVRINRSMFIYNLIIGHNLKRNKTEAKIPQLLNWQNIV